MIDGFSKTTRCPAGGWGSPTARPIIHEMIKLQQYSFVCAPQPVQWAGAAAMDVDMSPHIDAYRRKRDLIVAAWPTATNWSRRAAPSTSSPKPPGAPARSSSPGRSRNTVLIIPGNVFSRRDTHFRISYAAADAVIQRGIEVLRKLAGF